MFTPCSVGNLCLGINRLKNRQKRSTLEKKKKKNSSREIKEKLNVILTKTSKKLKPRKDGVKVDFHQRSFEDFNI